MTGSSKMQQQLFHWRDIQLKITCPFNTNKHLDEWNEIHKLDLQLSSSTNIRLPTISLILLITGRSHTSSELTSSLSNDSCSFPKTLNVSSLNTINQLLLSQSDSSFPMRTLDMLLLLSNSIFSKNCSSLSKQLTKP